MNGEVQGEGGGSPAERFWEEHYRASTRPSNGRPSGALVRFARPLPGGTARDLGCSQGDDAVWLARRGWRVVAVDVSGTVLARAVKNAETAGVSDLIVFERHDLARTFPNGRFDLVSALFLHSPVEFPRTRVLRAAARAVAPGGLLLIVEHASVAPWSSNVSLAEDLGLEDPAGPTVYNGLQITLYTHTEVRQAGSPIMERVINSCHPPTPVSASRRDVAYAPERIFRPVRSM